MRTIRGLRLAAAAAVGVGALLGTAVVGATAAGAQTSTTLTVTSRVNPIVVGQGALFVAQLSDGGKFSPKPTGTITFTITGSDNSTVSCAKPVSMSGAGKAVCPVAPGALTVVGSAYSVTASYSGDSSYDPATSNTVSETVDQAVLKLHLSDPTKPTNGGPAVFTVEAKAPITLDQPIVFAVSSDNGTKGTKPACSNGGNVQPLVDNVATCDLPAGWIIVPAPTKADPFPKERWGVAAVYAGDPNFPPTETAKGGTVRFS